MCEDFWIIFIGGTKTKDEVLDYFELILSRFQNSDCLKQYQNKILQIGSK